MIYLFEDRPERRLLHQDIIDRHKCIICFAKFDIDEGMILTDYIAKNFYDAEIMIIHKSYSFKSKSVNIDAIKKEMPDVKIVVFSGGTENGSIENDGNSVTINADVMYNNLEIFLKYITSKQEINFGPLVWGERFPQNRLVSFQHKLFREYFVNVDLDERIEDNDKGIDIDSLLDVIISYCDQYGVGIQDELFEEIMSRNIGLTWGGLLRTIQKHVGI